MSDKSLNLKYKELFKRAERLDPVPVLDKPFSDVREGNLVWLTAEDDYKIYGCEVLKCQRPATWSAQENNTNEQVIFIDWNGTWVDLHFSNWERDKTKTYHAFNHILVFTDKRDAEKFMKEEIQRTITECVHAKNNSVAELNNSTTEKDINHWLDEIHHLNETIESLKEDLNRI